MNAILQGELNAFLFHLLLLYFFDYIILGPIKFTVIEMLVLFPRFFDFFRVN